MNLNKKTIFAFIATALATLILEKIFNPILESLYALFLKLGTSFISSFSDSVFHSISDGYAEQTTSLVVYFIFIAFCCFLTYLSSELQTLYKEQMKKYDDIEKNRSKSSSNNQLRSDNDSEDIDATLEVTLETVEQLSKKTSEIKSQLDEQKLRLKEIVIAGKAKLRRELILLKITIAFFALFFIFIYGKQLFINSCITKTTCNIEIVSPYISDIEYKQLKSDFHSIKNLTDYEILYEKLGNIATEYNLELK